MVKHFHIFFMLEKSDVSVDFLVILATVVSVHIALVVSQILRNTKWFVSMFWFGLWPIHRIWSLKSHMSYEMRRETNLPEFTVILFLPQLDLFHVCVYLFIISMAIHCLVWMQLRFVFCLLSCLSVPSTVSPNAV